MRTQPIQSELDKILSQTPVKEDRIVVSYHGERFSLEANEIRKAISEYIYRKCWSKHSSFQRSQEKKESRARETLLTDLLVQKGISKDEIQKLVSQKIQELAN